MPAFTLLRVAAVALIAFGGGVRADAPRNAAVFGLELGASAQSIAAALAERYRTCRVVKSVYNRSPGEPAEYVAELAVNPGLISNDIGPNVCTYSPAGDDITDSIEVRFVHPDIDAGRIAYSIAAKRLFPDVVYLKPPRLRMSFEELQRQLFRTYGRPIDQRRERVASAAADLAKNLGMDRNVRRDDFLVRYLWAPKGRLPDVEREDASCDCGGRYVKALIEISRSPSTFPKNKLYVTSVVVVAEDADLRARQDAWNAQWQRPK